MDYQALKERIFDRFFRLEALLQGRLEGWAVHEEAVVVNLKQEGRRINLVFGPIEGDEAKDKQWVMTEPGREALPD